MGRPRQYASATERQAAYRQRRKVTTPYERMTTASARLHAIGRAFRHGVPAQAICVDEWDIDEADVGELGSLEALKLFQRQREVERYDW